MGESSQGARTESTGFPGATAGGKDIFWFREIWSGSKDLPVGAEAVSWFGYGKRRCVADRAMLLQPGQNSGCNNSVREIHQGLSAR
ncbi:hypothetical protein ES705_21417 [subsurface metagenome]